MLACGLRNFYPVQINSEGLDEDLVSKEETDESRLQEGGNPTTEEAEPKGLEHDKREDGGEVEQLDQMASIL